MKHFGVDSVDGPLFHPLSVYLFLPLFFMKKSNTDPQRHNHAALPFSNISCPPLFLSMRLNWCKTKNKKTLAHTIQCREKQSFFFPPQFHSARTKAFCPTNIFIGTLGSHRLNSAKQRGKDFLFYMLSVCAFSHAAHNSMSRCWVSVTHSFAIVWVTWLALWIAQGHSFLTSDSCILIPTQWFNWFPSSLRWTCSSLAGIIHRAPVQEIKLYIQNVMKVWNDLPDWLWQELTCF